MTFDPEAYLSYEAQLKKLESAKPLRILENLVQEAAETFRRTRGEWTTKAAECLDIRTKYDAEGEIDILD